ncbi:hypothetical protein [Sphingomonas sp. TDK1]|uniref:hypothetical protein n=1 Tax=Sphingomonas sp. TDK1 TaxID=453247 RepID=UPI0007DA21C2|nr:hypothetical protein [Sphingomonas sp. TDK1]OAN63907.1 hypothetical protein A7X12_19090 [Sphingomonas sp. TDK1]
MTSHAMAALLPAVKLDASTPVGDDADVALLAWMLEATRPWPAQAEATLQALLDAHRGGQADPAAWRGLRRAAVTLGDEGDPHLTALGRVAEAAAWPLGNSASALVELLRAICQLRAFQASRASGWTTRDQEEAETILNGIADGDGTRVPERHEIPGLFQVSHPALAKRFVAQLEASNQAYRQFSADVAAWIKGTLS